MVGWHYWLNGHESEQALGVGDGQGSLVCCSPWGHRVGHDWVTKLNWGLGLRVGIRIKAQYLIWRHNTQKPRQNYWYIQIKYTYLPTQTQTIEGEEEVWLRASDSQNISGVQGRAISERRSQSKPSRFPWWQQGGPHGIPGAGSSSSLGVIIESVNLTPLPGRLWLVLWRPRSEQVADLASTQLPPKRTRNTDPSLKSPLDHQPCPLQLSDRRTQRRCVNGIFFELLMKTVEKWEKYPSGGSKEAIFHQ